jgi:putative transposase
VEAFRTRPLQGAYPYLFLDAKVEKVRDGGRVVNKALVIAHGVHETGRREILSIDVGEAETEAFWTDFLRGWSSAASLASSSRSATRTPA